MKVLLDENLPHTLRMHLTLHDVTTTAYAGWAGIKNGELLRLAEESGFEVLMTGDRNLRYQQNLAGRRISIVELTATQWMQLSPHLNAIREAVEKALPGSFEVVVCKLENT